MINAEKFCFLSQTFLQELSPLVKIKCWYVFHIKTLSTEIKKRDSEPLIFAYGFTDKEFKPLKIDMCYVTVKMCILFLIL